MGTYFLDTSALIKRYVAEPGQTRLAGLCDPQAGNAVFISQATLVEAVATLCRKARETPAQVTTVERDRLIDMFRDHARRQYSVVDVNIAVYTRAADLCRTHPLRAYDAVQLACALAVRDQRLALGIFPVFVCADANLLRIASAERFSMENPNQYP
jgi:predicted nucleic acid-binding protein